MPTSWWLPTGSALLTRPALFPGHPGLRYAGFTTWRLLTGPVTGQVAMAESWGRGTVFGVMPRSDGRVHRLRRRTGSRRRTLR